MSYLDTKSKENGNEKLVIGESKGLRSPWSDEVCPLMVFKDRSFFFDKTVHFSSFWPLTETTIMQQINPYHILDGPRERSTVNHSGSATSSVPESLIIPRLSPLLKHMDHFIWYYNSIIILKSFEVVILSFFMIFGDLLQNLSHRSIGLF